MAKKTLLTAKIVQASIDKYGIEKNYNRLVELINKGELENNHVGWCGNVADSVYKSWGIHYIFTDPHPHTQNPRYRIMVWRDEKKVEIEPINH